MATIASTTFRQGNAELWIVGRTANGAPGARGQQNLRVNKLGFAIYEGFITDSICKAQFEQNGRRWSWS